MAQGVGFRARGSTISRGYYNPTGTTRAVPTRSTTPLLATAPATVVATVIAATTAAAPPTQPQTLNPKPTTLKPNP